MKICDVNKQTLDYVISESYSYSEILNKLKLSIIPRNRKDLKQYILDNNININHFDFYHSNKSRRKFRLIEKICPQCNKSFISSEYGKTSKITCSLQCSNLYFSHKRMNKQIAEKIRSTLLSKPTSIISRKNKEKFCEQCSKSFIAKNKKQICCSIACGAQHRIKNPEYIVKCSEIQKRLIKEGKHNGWTTRNILSYPEKYFKEILEVHNIQFKMNFPVKKRELAIEEHGCYFLDFLIENKKIDLEIDGSQHNRLERRQADNIRDNRLSAAGYTVFRIKWKNPVNDINRKFLHDQFAEFLKLYNSV